MAPFLNTLKNLENNQELAYSFIRIFLGIALLVRGIILFSNPDMIRELASAEQLFAWYSYITIGHIFGGLFLLIGVYTRLAALIQIPIMFGAVFLVHMKNGLVMGGQSLELAALVLFLLIIYLIFGSGKLTVASLFRK